MAENLVTKKIHTLTIDSLTLGLVLPVDSLYLQNVYVDVDDTHIRTAAFNFSAALVDGSALIDLPASSIGSIYHLQLLNAGAQVLSVFLQCRRKTYCCLSWTFIPLIHQERVIHCSRLYGARLKVQ